jgi:hypothetical protein
MVFAVPEQRAMAHLRLHLLSPYAPNVSPDAIPFGLSASKSDPPAIGPNARDPPPPGTPGSPFGPNCVGCISTQNLADGAVTNPKLATGSVLSANIGAGAVATPNIADQAITTPKIAPGAVSITPQTVENATGIIPPGGFGTAIATCPHGTILTGGGYGGGTPFRHVQFVP